ncbi:hypothetical protein J6590_051078 [Homalodisca vitripennis]|nr:hypothetical protein J6590_051078 [Homalodisca vitripennis]
MPLGIRNFLDFGDIPINTCEELLGLNGLDSLSDVFELRVNLHVPQLLPFESRVRITLTTSLKELGVWIKFNNAVGMKAVDLFVKQIGNLTSTGGMVQCAHARRQLFRQLLSAATASVESVLRRSCDSAV